jgi:hypothetical protein
VADLVVDLGMLAETADELSALISEFGDASKIVSTYTSAVGDADLAGALEEFAGNWRVHREKLLSSMHAVHQMASQSHRSYINTDEKLARDLRTGGSR